MKTRHAVALALVGWYLMVPPTGYDAHGIVEAKVDTPLSKWQSWGSFDSGSACDAELAQIRQKSKENPVETRHHGQQVRSAVCIASDDRRLAK
jgi:hypothetical protein